MVEAPAEQRREPLSRLRAWVEQVYRPGYGHLAATLGPCWEAHDLCLYGLDILAELWSVLYLQDQRSAGLLSAQAEYQARILPALSGQFMTETTDAVTSAGQAASACGASHDRRHAPPGPGLRFTRLARVSLPAGPEDPATRHGYRDATTDQERITAWFGHGPSWNLAIATGTPGPDVLDVDQHGPAGHGFAALERLKRAGLLEGASACVGTPKGGLHVYFAGTSQRNGHLADHHLDFRSAGGYILAPPSQVHGKPYRLIKTLDGQGTLDWAAVTHLLQPMATAEQTRVPPRHGH